jgi:hypothetical protein
MAEQKNKPQLQEDEIDIMEYIVKLWKKRSLIIRWGCVGAVIGLIIGLSLPATYKSSVTFAPETTGNMGSSVSGLAAMMGVSIDNSSDAISIEMLPDVVHSTPFIVDLFDIPVQFERNDSVITTSLYNYMITYQKKPWWSPILKAPQKAIKWCKSLFKKENKPAAKGNGKGTEKRNIINLSKKERMVVAYFAEEISVSTDKKTGKALIELELQDPLVVYTVVQAIVDNYKEYMSEYRTSKTHQDVVNLTKIYHERKADYHKSQQTYAKFVDANKNVILQSVQAEQERLQQEMSLAYQIYSQVATQLESARIKEQETKPVFVVLEPAVIPDMKSAPSKAKLLILLALLSGCFASAWVLFGADIFKSLKKATEEEEEQEE